MPEAVFEQLVAETEIELPVQLAVGRGNAFVVAGHCHHPTLRTERLELEVGGERQPLDRFGLPRQDVYARHREAESRAFKSGFVGLATIRREVTGEAVEVCAVARLENGSEARARLGSVATQRRLTPPEGFSPPSFPASASGPRVAICMATYNPPAELLRRQLDSIRGQTHENWVCVVSDDGSEPGPLEALRKAIGDDPRFALSPAPERTGYYRNFERALSMAPEAARFVTLCDQDDRWAPGKLERLLSRIGGSELAYSDARIVDTAGRVLHDSYWSERRNNHTNYGSLLIANSVTGAASLFTRGVLEDALPFPQAIARPFHDHWLATVALSRGEITYLPEPLYDYVQHDAAVIGHAGANRRPRGIPGRLREQLRNPGDGSRIVYYYDWYQQLLFAEVLRLRCWESMTASKRRTLRRLRGADTGFAGLAWLLGRWPRRFWGHDETLDRELFYGYALARRRAVSLSTLGRSRPGRRLPRDASIPPAPGQREPA